MPVLTSVYRSVNRKGDEYYFQKSRVFIYPVLGIEKVSSVTPIETYLSWDTISHYDMKLLCLYYARADAEFAKFESKKLIGNMFFEEAYEVEPDDQLRSRKLYKFNLNCLGQNEWSTFLKGKYSQLSEALKDKIKDHYRGNSVNFAYAESFLYPKKYYKNYSELLGTPVSVLQEAGELTSKPDLQKEQLHIRSKIDFNL